MHHPDDNGNTKDVTSSIFDANEDLLSFIAEDSSKYTIVVVPEPSTYAMIFGALALGLVVYRRRR